MKVDRNQQIGATWQGSFQTAKGVPLRLEIATRIIAAWNTSGDMIVALDHAGLKETRLKAIAALTYADQLIDAHNETCEDKP